MKILIVFVFFALFAGNAFAQACVDMPALLGYIGEWKAGTMQMATLLGYIGEWKTGTGCGTGTMTTASRTSCVAPCGVFFDAIDDPSISWASSVVQPTGFVAQPVMTGVRISRIEYGTSLGTGTLSFDAAAKTLSWRASGDSAGASVPVSAGGSFALPSGNGRRMFIWVDSAQLPVSNASENVSVVNGGLNADWASFDYQWNFGDALSGTWTNGALKSDGTHYSKNSEIGWNAAHVYENSGNYTVSLTITDDTGTAHIYQQDIAVNPEPAGGWITYYFAANGNDSNPGTEALPKQTWANAVSLAANRVKLLFRRGDTFEAGVALDKTLSGPLYIGAYETGNRPVFHIAGTNHFVRGANLADSRFLDLVVDGEYPAVPNLGMGFDGLGTDSLVLRTRVQDMQEGYWVNWGRRNSIVQDCEAANIKRFHFWADGEGYRAATLGCTMSGGHTEWLFRSYADRHVLAHSTFSDQLNSKGMSRFIADNWGIMAFNKYQQSTSEQVIWVHEDVQNSVNVTPRHILLNGNVFEVDSGTSYMKAVNVQGGENITITNNRMYSTSLNGTFVGMTAGSIPTRYVDSVRVIGNSAYYSGATNGFGFTSVDTSLSSIRNIVVANNAFSVPQTSNNQTFGIGIPSSSTQLYSNYNLWHIPNVASPFSTGPTTSPTRLTPAQWIALGKDTTSVWLSPVFSNPTSGDLRLTGSSSALNKGTGEVLPYNRFDADGKPRGPAPDLGALEYP
ncbi:MAG TPA: hypothetical protein VI977_06040 [archaeon]|nr:hypothetical protein [archaeon]